MELIERYEKWRDIATMSGPVGLKLIRGFRDQGLRWKGKSCRASVLNKAYRIIYRIAHDGLRVQALETTGATRPRR